MVLFEGLRVSLAQEELHVPAQRFQEKQKNESTDRGESIISPTGSEKAQPGSPRLLLRSRSVDYAKLERTLGRGPMRFAPVGERSIQEQVDSLAPNERSCFDRLKAEGESIDSQMNPKALDTHDELYLRFSRCTDFQYERAAALMKNWLAGSSFFSLRCTELEEQLLTETLFIVPGLKTKDGLDVFYMRPSRYFPKETPTSTVIDNLAYVIQVMEEKETSCTKGITLMANMAGWTRHNFSLGYCFEFMNMLQGNVVPAKVQLFLIVDPPVWFDIIWRIMHEMFSKEFAQKVHMVKSQDLCIFLQDGYRDFLPGDMEMGKSRNNAAVTDFVRYRRNVEGDGDASYFQTIIGNVRRG